MPQTIGIVTYDQPVTTNEARSLEWFSRLSSPTTGADAGRTVVDFYLNFSDDAVPQKEEILVESVPGADAYYHVTIAGTTSTKKFAIPSYTADTNTTAEIAAEIAAIVGTHPDVFATVLSGSTVTVTSLVPGDNFTCTVSCSNKADNSAVNSAISTSTATAASGTMSYGKIFSVANYISVRSNQFRLDMVARAYDGADPPVILGGDTALAKASPRSTADYTA
jgi:hypothetical protein